VGVDYGKAKIQGKQFKILFVAMDRGGDAGTDKETFETTQCSFRESTETRPNPHMGGVSLIMKELVDDKEPTVYSHQFALTNAVKCSKPSEHRKYEASEEMRKNCAFHLEKEIEVLNPDLIITQGSPPLIMVKSFLNLEPLTNNPFKHLNGRGKCDIFKHESLIVLTTFHPARLKDMKWKQGTIPKYMESAIHKTQELILKLNTK
jgi:uracil-DNA glycosylase family 4